MSTTIEHNIELPAGYTILDRLGAGGYGEVWKATAPGGVEKAIKIVFGHCDEGMAERELKSLERIKSVRHPFVLSIERFEIVNHRLVIVTELADMSLNDCFQRYLSEGKPGIPRGELIAYLRDAADALDCLVANHSLQHLDIKPENLLVVGDHIKVADFGLVKELASKTLNSMMGGMTPLYSAPEIYDDNPSAFSDQYSLAIVYQHMLTGSLPFPGRTPAQLAKQHTLAEPNLDQLGEADRRIVRKALEKVPANRFSSCGEFVAALQSAGQLNAVSGTKSGVQHGMQSCSPIASDDTKSINLADTKHNEDPIITAATQVLSEIKNTFDHSQNAQQAQSANTSPRSYPRVDPKVSDLEIGDLDGNASTESLPTLFVGVGGMGIQMLRAIRSQAAHQDPKEESALAWLAIDTERESLKPPSDGPCYDLLSTDEKLCIPLRRPQEYREESQSILKWVSRRWLYNIPRSLQTRGFRPLGRIAIVDHAAEVFSALQKRLHGLAMKAQTGEQNPRPIRVVLLAGMSGGTGSGTVIDLAQGLRSLCQEHSQEVMIHGLLATTFQNGGSDSLAAANMYSFLTELCHVQLHGNCGECPPPGPASRFELPERAFDELYTVAMPPRGDRTGCDTTLRSIADYLLLEAGGSTAPVINALRTMNENAADHAYLRTFSCIDVDQLANSDQAIYQRKLTTAIVQWWLKPKSENADRDASCFEQYANSQFAHAVLKQFPINVSNRDDDSEEAQCSLQDNQRKKRIQGIAKAFLQFVDRFQPNGDEVEIVEIEVLSAGNQIIERICKLLPSNGITQQDLAQEFSNLLAEYVSEKSASASHVQLDSLANTALTMFERGPLACGYQRRTMLFMNGGQDDSELVNAFKESCPTLANYQASVAATYLIREGSGLHPLHLGARLAETYPDVDEAASRLHTRSDISWIELRGLQ